MAELPKDNIRQFGIFIRFKNFRFERYFKVLARVADYFFLMKEWII